MSSLRLKPTSSLGSAALPAANNGVSLPGVTIAERPGISLCRVLACKGDTAQLSNRVRQVFGLELPQKPRYTGTSSTAFAWAGPLQWLVLSEGIDGQALQLQLRSSLGDSAYVIDQSDSRTIVRIGGSCARGALAKGVHIDLHPRAFQPGDVAITAVAYVGVHFWQIDAVPTYEFAILRSFAMAFWEWILDAAAEFGVAVRQAPPNS